MLEMSYDTRDTLCARSSSCVQALLTSRASTVGDDLQVVKQDQLIKSDPSDYKRRRTIAIQRAHGGSCGFTLQVISTAYFCLCTGTFY